MDIRAGLIISSMDHEEIVFGFVSYVKSTHSKNTFSQWYWHYNILEASLSSIMAILLTTHPNDSDAMTQISSLP